MGGLRKWMPITFWTFLAAALANAGVIPFAGFWSKDEIIVGGWISSYQPIGTIATVVGLVSAFFTALYMFRLVFLVFTGRPRFDTAHVHPHESPPSMAIPLVLLAIPSLLLGVLIGWPPEDGRLHQFLNPVFYGEAAEEADHASGSGTNEVASLYTVASAQEEAGTEEIEEHATGPHHASQETIITFGVISTITAVAGILVAYLTYVTGTINAAALANRYRALYEFLYDKWRWDELYDRVLVQPLKALAMGLWQIVDVGIIDGAVNGVATGIGAISQRLRHVQTGLVANYALAIALGMVVLVGIFLGLFSDLFR
jgi:NADH-quinone oxidoreductase subunit L